MDRQEINHLIDEQLLVTDMRGKGRSDSSDPEVQFEQKINNIVKFSSNLMGDIETFYIDSKFEYVMTQFKEVSEAQF